MLCQNILVAAAFAGFAAALDTGLPAPWDTCCNLTSAEIGAYDTANPGSIQQWKQATFNACNDLCGGVGNYKTNTQGQTNDDLSYSCVCDNGKSPNMSDYANTLPSNECQQWANDCTAAFTTNSSAQYVCQHVNCGTNNVSADAVSSSSSSASPSSTSASSSSGTGSAASATTTSASSTSSSGALPIAMSREASTGFVGAVLFGLFSLFL